MSIIDKIDETNKVVDLYSKMYCLAGLPEYQEDERHRNETPDSIDDLIDLCNLIEKRIEKIKPRIEFDMAKNCVYRAQAKGICVLDDVIILCPKTLSRFNY